MKKITELAPAKLNLYLKVLRKRKDGYHEIATLFERINIFDTITASHAKEGIDIKCDDLSVPTGKGSLCHRAVELVKDKFKIKAGVKILIKKNIPIAAGLGGGSSDAASILKALNELWALKLRKDTAMEIGRLLGADVPFFIADCPFAMGRRRGDYVKPIKSKNIIWHTVITPDITMLTGDIYRLYSEINSLTLTIKRSVVRIHSPALYLSDINRLKALLHNDLERVVLSREPVIKSIKNTLEENNGRNTLVTGSGPSVFGLYSTRKEASRAKERILKRFPDSLGWRAFIARTY